MRVTFQAVRRGVATVLAVGALTVVGAGSASAATTVPDGAAPTAVAVSQPWHGDWCDSWEHRWDHGYDHGRYWDCYHHDRWYWHGDGRGHGRWDHWRDDGRGRWYHR